MNAKDFIKQNYTLTNSGKDCTCNHSGQLVGVEDVAEEYHKAKLKLLGLVDGEVQTEKLKSFAGWLQKKMWESDKDFDELVQEFQASYAH
jgi:hypothetical protein